MKQVLLALILACTCYASDATYTGIVASKTFASITTDVPSTTLFTPATAGVFRVTMCAVQSGSSAGGVGLETDYTDTNGTAKSVSDANGAEHCVAEPSFIAEASAAISFKTNNITGSGNTYTVYVVLERLQ